MSVKRLLSLLMPPKDRLGDVIVTRLEADQTLDELEATLDGEDKWFLTNYNDTHKEAPACGIRQKHRTQE